MILTLDKEQGRMSTLTAYSQHFKGGSSQFDQEREIKHIHIRKEEIKLFSDKLIRYTDYFKRLGKKNQEYHLELISEFSKVT